MNQNQTLAKMSRIGLVMVVAASFVGPLAGVLSAASVSQWSSTPASMNQGRMEHSATLLSGPECRPASGPEYCGKVLVAGGRSGNQFPEELLASSELYDPKDGSWSSCGEGSGRAPSSKCPGPMQHPRFGHSATQILGTSAQCGDHCGKVLVAGQTYGQNRQPDLRTAELYNPASGKWEAAPRIPSNITTPLNVYHSATLLPNGEVLFVGRDDIFTGYPGLLFDPTPADPGQPWSETAGSTVVPRHRHSAVLLRGPNCGVNCGKVLLAGGGAGGEYAFGNSAELFDPSTGTFAPTGALLYSSHGTLITLEDGTVLLAGADQGPQSQVYNPETGTWRPTGSMGQPRGGGILVNLSGNRVLAAGGNATRDHEIYYPAELGPDGVRGVWKQVPNSLSQPHADAKLVSLGCEAGEASALVAGGHDNNQTLSDAETYTRRVRVTGLSPAYGRAAGGATLTIQGSGFTSAFPGGTKVMFGDAEGANATVKSDNELTVTSPAGEGSKKVNVVVSVDGGVPECSPQLEFDYLPVPQLTGINPPAGPALGGTRVTLTGSGFPAGSSVRFGGQPARSVTVSGDGSRITADAPPNNPGIVPVVVTSPAGDVVETSFRYLPAITGVVPDSGPPEGGTTVTIAGKGFSGARTVSFGGTEVTPIEVADTAVTVKSPPHPPGQVRVGVDVPPHGPAIPMAAGADTFTYGAEAVPLGGGSGQTSVGGSTSVAPGSQTPTTSGGGPSAAGGSAPPPPGQGQAVPLLSQSPVSAFEPGSSVMQSGSASPVQSPGGVQAPGAAGSQAPGPQPALVSVPEIRPDRAEQYAMVGLSGKAVDPAGFGLAAGLVGLLLCGGFALRRRESALKPQARPQEAF